MKWFAGPSLIIAAACLGILGNPTWVEVVLLFVMALIGGFVLLLAALSDI